MKMHTGRRYVNKWTKEREINNFKVLIPENGRMVFIESSSWLTINNQGKGVYAPNRGFPTIGTRSIQGPFGLLGDWLAELLKGARCRPCLHWPSRHVCLWAKQGR
jgi:hypothetical protein